MSEPKLDFATCMVLQPVVDSGNRAIQERDAWHRWSVELARVLGVNCGDFRSDEVADQYAELRERIDMALPKWLPCVGLPVSELPQGKVLALLKWGKIDIVELEWRQGWNPDYWKGGGGEYDIPDVTHWMPLPSTNSNPSLTNGQHPQKI